MKKTLVNRLVAQTMSAQEDAAGCVPCLGGAMQKLCFAASQTAPAKAKN